MRILMIPKQLVIEINRFVARVDISARHVRMYTCDYTGKSQHLYTLSFLFISSCKPLARICVTIVSPPGTLKQPQAENVSNTGYNYKQGVEKLRYLEFQYPS